MKNIFLFIVSLLLVGCSTVIKIGDKVERAATPPDAVNYVTTKPDGSYEVQLSDHRFAGKLFIVSIRKFKNQGGFLQVQCEMKNGSFLRQDFNVSFEFLSADGRIVEAQRNWDTIQLEPGAMHTYTATALRSEAVECRFRFLSK